MVIIKPEREPALFVKKAENSADRVILRGGEIGVYINSK